MDKSNYVVFVDDEVDLHELFRTLLKKTSRSEGFLVECFENGLDCYNFVSARKDEINILLIVSDLNMPVMNGFELLKKVKESFPGIKVIISSAYTDKETTTKAMSLGAESFLEKPININQVISEIKIAMGS